MNKRLYIGFSPFELVWTMILRLAALLAIIYSLPHYQENPVVISVFVAICAAFILFIGEDQIVIYPGKLIQTTNSLSSLLVKTKGRVYEIENIKYAYLRAESSLVDIGAMVIISMLLSKKTSNSNTSRPIFLEMKDGNTVTLNTNLESDKMQKIVSLVNSLVTVKM